MSNPTDKTQRERRLIEELDSVREMLDESQQLIRQGYSSKKIIPVLRNPIKDPEQLILEEEEDEEIHKQEDLFSKNTHATENVYQQLQAEIEAATEALIDRKMRAFRELLRQETRKVIIEHLKNIDSLKE